MAYNSDFKLGSGCYIKDNNDGKLGFQKISTTEVTGSAVQTVDISCVLANYDYLVLKFNLLNSNVASALYSLYFNADTTATNYRECYGQFDGTNPVPGGKSNDSVFTGVGSGKYCTGEIQICMRGDGKAIACAKTARDAGASWNSSTCDLLYDVATAITNIKFTNDKADGIGIGSTFTLYGFKS